MLQPGQHTSNTWFVAALVLWVAVAFPLYMVHLIENHFIDSDAMAHLLEYMGAPGLFPLLIHLVNVWQTNKGDNEDDGSTDVPGK